MQRKDLAVGEHYAYLERGQYPSKYSQYAVNARVEVVSLTGLYAQGRWARSGEPFDVDGFKVDGGLYGLVGGARYSVKATHVLVRLVEKCDTWYGSTEVGDVFPVSTRSLRATWVEHEANVAAEKRRQEEQKAHAAKMAQATRARRERALTALERAGLVYAERFAQPGSGRVSVSDNALAVTLSLEDFEALVARLDK